MNTIKAKDNIKQSISHLNIRHIWAAAGLCVCIAAVSFYFTEGYADIGEDKYRMFLWTAGCIVPVWAVMYLAALIRGALRKETVSPENGSCAGMTAVGVLKSLGKAEWCALFMIFAGVISTLTSRFRHMSLWGYDGWHMGLIVQGLMIGCCLMAVDLCARGNIWLIRAVAAAAFVISAAVFILGDLNRFSIYPFRMIGQAEDFISTLGNINWFCGYWCVWTGLACGVFLMTKNTVIRSLMAVYLWLAGTTGICCGASSCYLAWAGIGYAALLWALEDPDRMMRLCDMEMLLFTGLPTVRLMGALRPYRMWYDSSWLKGVTYGDDWMAPFILGIVIFCLIHELCRLVRPRTAWLRPLIVGSSIGITAAVIIIIVLNTMTEGGIWPVRGMRIFTWGTSWGNGRGGIWIVSMDLVRQLLPLRIFFGAGCDCFGALAYDSTETVVKLAMYLGNQYLTNAHNELLSMLVNEGIVGVLAYFGFQISNLGNAFGKERSDSGLLLGAGLCGAAYMAVALVGFMHVLATPFYFIIIGIAAGLKKRAQINYN